MRCGTLKYSWSQFGSLSGFTDSKRVFIFRFFLQSFLDLLNISFRCIRYFSWRFSSVFVLISFLLVYFTESTFFLILTFQYVCLGQTRSKQITYNKPQIFLKMLLSERPKKFNFFFLKTIEDDFIEIYDDPGEEEGFWICLVWFSSWINNLG